MMMTNKANELLLAYADLTWDAYVELTTKLSSINRNNVDGELADLPQKYSYYSGLLSVAKKEVEKARLDLEQYMATTRQEEYNRRMASGQKATDKYLESYVMSQELYKEYNEALYMSNFKYNLLRDLVNALSIKKDALVQLSANSRAEAKIYN